MRTPLYFLMAATCCASASHAGTIVVDNQNPRAADTNPGTREAPLKTISAAALLAQAGDEVLVRPGIYRESVTLPNSGKAGQPIIFRSEVPRAAIVSGSDVVTEWRSEGPGVWSMSAPGLKNRNSTTNPTPNGSNPEWIYVNGFPLERAPSRGQLAPGSFLLDFETQRVLVSPEEGQNIGDLKVEYANREGTIIPARPLDDIHIIGFTVTHCADWFRGKHALNISGRRWLVENNHVKWISYQGITTGGATDCVVRSNLVEWCGNAAIGGGSTMNLLVEDNKFYFCNWRRFRPSGEGGISKWSGSIDSRLRRNEAAYFFGYGLWFDGINSGNIMENNICHDSMGGASLFSEISWSDVIRDNIAYNNQHGITVGESPGTAVLRNVVFNNEIGIRMRGNYGRNNSADVSPEAIERVSNAFKRIPDISETRHDQVVAQYTIYWASPAAFLSNNSVVRDNILFDNVTNYFEHRNYGKPSAIDPFINNFSDYNIYYAANPEANITYGGGTYPDFSTWQKFSKRDKNSRFADPRAASTSIPDWAKTKRALWDIPMRPIAELKSLKLGLVDSPMAAYLNARVMRSKVLKSVKVSDPQVKAWQFEVDGRNTVAVWTSQPGQRRYVRLNTGVDTLNQETGFGEKSNRKTTGGVIEVVATYSPLYLHGVGQQVTEVPATTLTARAFNLPGQSIPLTAAVVNTGKAARKLDAKFLVPANYTAQPAQISRQLKPGERAEIKILLTPKTPFLGTGQVRMEATFGDEKVLRTTSFIVGEGSAQLPKANGQVTIDGKIDDWGALTSKPPIGLIADASQITSGDKKTWSGVADNGAKLYSAWTPTALYAVAVVTDQTVFDTPGNDEPYNHDAIEFFLDGRASDMQWQGGITEGAYQFIVGLAPDGKAVTRVFGPGALQGFESATSRTADGYIVEMKIPLTPQNFPALEWNVGRTVKMALVVDDRDDPNATVRENVIGWGTSPSNRTNTDTSGWVTLVLED